MAKKKSSATENDYRTIIVLILLFTIYPAGLIMMFVWNLWPKWAKILALSPLILLITLWILIFFVGVMTGISSTNPKSTYQQTPVLYDINNVSPVPARTK